MEGAKVAGFMEKPRGDGGLINGGFFVLSPHDAMHPLLDGDLRGIET
jgi:glucose-1-phosphate cytidylyltransferase